MSLLTNLVSYYQLDEASGNALDANSTNGMTAGGAPGAGTGVISGCRTFDGAKNFSHASNAALQLSAGDFTIAGWAKLAAKAANYFVVGKDNLGTSGQRDYGLLYRASKDRFELQVFNATDVGTDIDANTFGSPATGTWYYVVGWWDATAKSGSIQVNGGTVNTVSVGVALQTPGTAAVAIGSRVVGGALESGMNGSIDEVGLWSRVLTSGERASLYNSGAGLAYSSFGGGAAVHPWWLYACQNVIGGAG